MHGALPYTSWGRSVLCAIAHDAWGRADGGAVPYVAVGPFRVMDATRGRFVEHVVGLVRASPARPVLVYALHVGGLNARQRPDFVSAMNSADAVYADGGSVVWLAKIAGARDIERAPTTDVGWDVIRALSDELERPVRVALVGGPVGLAERAGRALEEGAPAQVVMTDHGYHRDWDGIVRSLHEAAPDVTLVGMGAPAEMVWCQRERDRLPPGLVLTCGGWFGHMVGDERRAPKLLRHSGIEWVARVAQSPGRLGPRYVRGVGSSVAMSVPALRNRVR
jgi:N-acetylglucosaminyldiphosphoundecaprenol N-acetyl-beta-D-mannosaminyltransferase